MIQSSEFPDWILSGQVIQLRNEANNQYLYSQNLYLTTGSKQQMLGCTAFYNQPNCQFRIILANTAKNNNNNQEIFFGDHVVLQWKDQYIKMTNNASQSEPKLIEAVVTDEQFTNSQLFVVLPADITLGEPDQLKKKFRIKHFSSICLYNLQYKCYLNSELSHFTQENLLEFKEVNGSPEPSVWIINLHSINLMNGFPQIIQRSFPLVECIGSVIIHHSATNGCLNFENNQLNHLDYQQLESKQKLGAFTQSYLWDIIQQQKLQNSILTNTPHLLINVLSNKYLAPLVGPCFAPGKLYVECRASMKDADQLEEWEFINCDKNSPLKYFDPFVIRNKRTKLYLAADDKIVYLTTQMSFQCTWTFMKSL